MRIGGLSEHVPGGELPESPTPGSVRSTGRPRTLDTSDGFELWSDERFAVGEATDVTIAPDGQRIAVASSLGQVTVFEDGLRNERSFLAVDAPARVDSLAFDPVTGFLATGLAERRGDRSFDDTVSVWDTTASTRTFTIGGEAEDVAGCAFFFGRVEFSADGELMAFASHDFTAIVVDTASGAVVAELSGATTILDLDFGPDNDILIATHDDATIDVWDTSEFTLRSSTRGAMGGYYAIEILPDGDRMVAVDLTGAISIVDVTNGETLSTLDGSNFRTTTLALSRVGAIVAAPTADAGIAFWSVGSGQQLAAVTGHTAGVAGIAFAPDMSWLASSSLDGTVRTWSIDRSS